MAGLRDLSAQAAGTCPGTGLLSGAHEGGVEQGACASGVVQQGKEKQEKHRELQATVPTDLRDDAMHATGLFFFVTAPGRFARGVRFTLGAILHVLHVCVWRANGRRARNALHPKSGIMQCLFGLMLSIRPTCQKYILYCIALSVRPRARNACCMILYCTERTADVPEMRLDYILGNDKMAAASARAAFVQRDADTNRLSDHLPVLFDFKLI